MVDGFLTCTVDQRAPKVNVVVGVPLDVEVDLDVGSWNGDWSRRFTFETPPVADHACAPNCGRESAEWVLEMSDFWEVRRLQGGVARVEAREILDAHDPSVGQRGPFPNRQSTRLDLAARH